MTVRNVVGVTVAVVAVAGFLSTASVHAKSCAKLCKQQIKECKQHFIMGCTDSSSDPKSRTCPTSPSGAFLD